MNPIVVHIATKVASAALTGLTMYATTRLLQAVEQKIREKRLAPAPKPPLSYLDGTTQVDAGGRYMRADPQLLKDVHLLAEIGKSLFVTELAKRQARKTESEE